MSIPHMSSQVAHWNRRKDLEHHMRSLPLYLFLALTLIFALFGARVTVFQTLVLLSLVLILYFVYRAYHTVLTTYKAQAMSYDLLSGDLALLVEEQESRNRGDDAALE